MKKFNYIFFSVDGHGLPVAYRLQQEGNPVFLGMVENWKDTGCPERKENEEQKKRRLSLFDGMIKRKVDANRLLEKMKQIENKDSYRVICDFNHLYTYADKIRKMGFSGFLPTKEDFLYEKDRKKAKDLVKKLYPQMEVAENWEFKKAEDALKMMEENPETFYVMKGFKEDAKTVVPDSNIPEVNHLEIKDYLTRYKKDYESEGFLLEEKIPDLVEFTPEAVSYNGKILSVSIDIEAKDIGAGETGFQTGCSLDTVFWINNKDIYKKFLKPLSEMMLRKNELTIWDAAVAFSPSRGKFYFLEFCMNRWGFNSIFTQLSTFTRATDYFERIFNEETLYKENTKMFGSSVRLFNLIEDPKNPGEKIKDSFVFAKDKKDVWLWDIKKDDSLRTAGYDKNMAVITGCGDDIYKSSKEAYENLIKYFNWTGALYRDRKDYMSDDYDASILNRLKVLKELFKLDEVKIKQDL